MTPGELKAFNSWYAWRKAEKHKNDYYTAWKQAYKYKLKYEKEKIKLQRFFEMGRKTSSGIR